jgi:hypothetical protein
MKKYQNNQILSNLSQPGRNGGRCGGEGQVGLRAVYPAVWGGAGLTRKDFFSGRFVLW